MEDFSGVYDADRDGDVPTGYTGLVATELEIQPLRGASGPFLKKIVAPQDVAQIRKFCDKMDEKNKDPATDEYCARCKANDTTTDSITLSEKQFHLNMALKLELRLRWLMWFDADTLVINPLVGVETFLPPSDLEGINMIVTEDWNGLNNGIFIMRVSAWSVNMLTDTLAYPSYKPDEDLPFTEQTAMERMIQDPRYARNCIFVPPRWFNAYPRDEDETRTKYHVQQGDMMLHFAGVGDRPKMIRAFHDHVAAEREKWEIPVAQTLLPEETADFWMNVRMQRQRQS
ncbi:hypothetical protein MBLNU13_g01668t2 [Cladosporium sp. NU13]